MKTLFLNFANTALSTSCKNRIDEILKDFYWNDAPENWSDFDGEITTIGLSDRSGDYAKIQFDSESKWFNWTIDFLKQNKFKFQIKSLEVSVKDSSDFEFVQNYENGKKNAVKFFKIAEIGSTYSLL
jgi:hypothetical protein